MVPHCEESVRMNPENILFNSDLGRFCISGQWSADRKAEQMIGGDHDAYEANADFVGAGEAHHRWILLWSCWL